MSYSFSAKGDDKAAALAAAAAQFDKMLEQQPVHTRDREAAMANLRAHLDLVEEPNEGEQVTISMHGSVSWSLIGPDSSIQRWTGAGSGCSVSVYLKPAVI
jgi:hypothetical protein